MFTGTNYVFKGISEFFRDPKLWKYALIPLLMTVALYSVLGFFCVKAVNIVDVYFNELVQSWSDFWQWLPVVMSYTVAILVIMAFILITIFTAGTFYELFGGPFFDRMIQNYEHRNYRFNAVNIDWKFELRALVDASLYSFATLLMLLALLFIGMFLPIIGPIVSFFVMSYRFGALYLAICNFRHGVTLHNTCTWAWRNFALTTGFGMIIQFIFLVPLLPLLLLPGVIIGGVLLLKDHFKLPLVLQEVKKVQLTGVGPNVESRKNP